MTPGIAYIDMEFAGIYGTHQSLQIPIEIGVAIHRPDADTLSFSGRAFSHDIDVELWKNIIDDMGKRVQGQRRVFNLASRGHAKLFDKKVHMGEDGRKKARRAIGMVHRDLREFMQTFNQMDIGTLVFFARRREMEAFRDSRVNTEGFLIRDLQEEIRSSFHLKEQVSLDRVSLVIQFGMTPPGIRSSHLSYAVPEKFRYLVKPHKAIGDAARMFLVDQEFHRFPEKFEELLTGHLQEYERRKVSENAAPDGGNGKI
jgi:hypothetical protein